MGERRFWTKIQRLGIQFDVIAIDEGSEFFFSADSVDFMCETIAQVLADRGVFVVRLNSLTGHPGAIPLGAPASDQIALNRQQSLRGGLAQHGIFTFGIQTYDP